MGGSRPRITPIVRLGPRSEARESSKSVLPRRNSRHLARKLVRDWGFSTHIGRGRHRNLLVVVCLRWPRPCFLQLITSQQTHFHTTWFNGWILSKSRRLMSSRYSCAKISRSHNSTKITASIKRWERIRSSTFTFKISTVRSCLRRAASVPTKWFRNRLRLLRLIQLTPIPALSI